MKCTRVELAAKNGLGGVEQCACGAVHLTIGAVTLRITPGAVPLLAELLSDAALALLRSRVPDEERAEAWS